MQKNPSDSIEALIHVKKWIIIRKFNLPNFFAPHILKQKY